MRDFHLYFAPILMAIMFLMALAMPASSEGMPCGDNNGTLQAQIIEQYGETIIDQQEVPNGRAELWANDETGSYTILFFPSGQSEAVVCIAGAGVDPELIDQSEPI